MRVLFYGGCHAQAFRDIFRRYADASHEFDQIKNFELIAAGQPFPYDRLSFYDWVIFSPIYNKPSYSTERLQEHCRSIGIHTLSFPWLQWQGYFPGSANDMSSMGAKEWFYPALIALARNSSDLPAFEAAVYDDRENGAATNHIARDAMTNLAFVADREKQSAIDLPATPLIRTHYAQQRLFLTPNHPSINLYRLLAAQIAERLGLRLSRTLETTAWEPQYGVKTPILPAVHTALGLAFRDSDYQSNVVQGTAGGIDFGEYLQRVFVTSRVRTGFKASWPTYLKGRAALADALAEGEKILVQLGDAVTYRDIEDHGAHMRLHGTQLNGRPIALFEPVYIFRPHWQQQRVG